MSNPMLGKMLTLQTSDAYTLKIRKEIVMQSTILRNMLEDVGDLDLVIPIPCVSLDVLLKVFEFCEYRMLQQSGKNIDVWETRYATMSSSLLVQVILAAQYLDIQLLTDYGLNLVIDRMRGKKAEEIRRNYNITSDFTQAEEAYILFEETQMEREAALKEREEALRNRIEPMRKRA